MNNPDFTAQNCLFGAVKITPDAKNQSKYKYSGYGICFDAEDSFSFGDRIDAKNVIKLGADMSFNGKNYTGNNNIYVLGKPYIQGFSTDGDGHTIDAKKKCTKQI